MLMFTALNIFFGVVYMYILYLYMGVSTNNDTSQIIHFNRVFHYKPSILGYPYIWKHPYRHPKCNSGMTSVFIVASHGCLLHFGFFGGGWKHLRWCCIGWSRSFLVWDDQIHPRSLTHTLPETKNSQKKMDGKGRHSPYLLGFGNFEKGRAVCWKFPKFICWETVWTLGNPNILTWPMAKL